MASISFVTDIEPEKKHWGVWAGGMSPISILPRVSVSNIPSCGLAALNFRSLELQGRSGMFMSFAGGYLWSAASRYVGDGRMYIGFMEGSLHLSFHQSASSQIKFPSVNVKTDLIFAMRDLECKSPINDFKFGFKRFCSLEPLKRARPQTIDKFVNIIIR
jgi:hypothetical protein